MVPKIHWPVSYRKPVNGTERFPINEETFGMDLVDVPLIETWKAMEALVKKGKCRTIGVSNFSKARLEEIWDAAEIKPAVNQVELHPYFAQDGFVKYCQDKVSWKGYLYSTTSPIDMRMSSEHLADQVYAACREWSSRRTVHSVTTSTAYQCKP